MNASQKRKVAAYRWAVETLEQARLQAHLAVGIEQNVVRLQVELQSRMEKIELNAELRSAQRKRLSAAYQRLETSGILAHSRGASRCGCPNLRSARLLESLASWTVRSTPPSSGYTGPRRNEGRVKGAQDARRSGPLTRPAGVAHSRRAWGVAANQGGKTSVRRLLLEDWHKAVNRSTPSTPDRPRNARGRGSLALKSADTITCTLLLAYRPNERNTSSMVSSVNWNIDSLWLNVQRKLDEELFKRLSMLKDAAKEAEHEIASPWSFNDKALFIRPSSGGVQWPFVLFNDDIHLDIGKGKLNGNCCKIRCSSLYSACDRPGGLHRAIVTASLRRSLVTRSGCR